MEGNEELSRVSIDDGAPVSAAAIADQIRVLEDEKSALSARQARLAVTFDLLRRAEQADAGMPADKLGAGVGAEIALARRESPAKGSRLLGLAKALVTEMPRTLAALEAGQLNEWRATLLVRETACLSAADRAAVDEELAADAGTFDGAGDRTITAAARAAAYRRDPRTVTERAAHAATERYVSVRPAPDTMCYLTALLPAAQAVAVYAALTRAADAARSDGDPRTRGQLMADALVDRTTGAPGGIGGISIQLVMTDRTLFQGDSEAARLPGYGIVPAGWARQLASRGAGTGGSGDRADDDSGPGAGNGAVNGSTAGHGGGVGRNPAFPVWLRRLYTAPTTGELTAMDSRARLFPAGLRRLIQARDDTCRTPYCDAPTRHLDHIIPWHTGGPTTATNGAGLCEHCNHTKETPGWTAQPRPGPGRHSLELTTPTGHTYRSTALPLPGTSMGGSREQRFNTAISSDLVMAARRREIRHRAKVQGPRRKTRAAA
ncbi:DUF222 domain-containing protein [Arthrobacter sp. Hor0625]|uniref:DUF222 domain-containing protein n=1 Tax=Arthrobacter sp. Hor0625 TaxID=3457358 RepID=UPI00403EA8DB